jgi:hypothetical protein
VLRLLRRVVRQARIAGTMSSSTISIGLKAAYNTPQSSDFVFK